MRPVTRARLPRECGSLAGLTAHAQVGESQKDAMKLVMEAAKKHVVENQRELSRTVLAPTVQARPCARCRAWAPDLSQAAGCPHHKLPLGVTWAAQRWEGGLGSGRCSSDTGLRLHPLTPTCSSGRAQGSIRASPGLPGAGPHAGGLPGLRGRARRRQLCQDEGPHGGPHQGCALALVHPGCQCVPALLSCPHLTPCRLQPCTVAQLRRLWSHTPRVSPARMCGWPSVSVAQ